MRAHPGEDGQHLIRPYMRDRPGPAAAPGERDVAILRPFLLTAGRVAQAPLELEAQVVATQLGRTSYHQLAFERRDIVVLCHTAMSVAEVAARLQYHVGVARVLIADLHASGHVLVRRPDADPVHDLATIEKVIRALEAIR
jgi:hypothetical protein